MKRTRCILAAAVLAAALPVPCSAQGRGGGSLPARRTKLWGASDLVPTALLERIESVTAEPVLSATDDLYLLVNPALRERPEELFELRAQPDEACRTQLARREGVGSSGEPLSYRTLRRSFGELFGVFERAVPHASLRDVDSVADLLRKVGPAEQVIVVTLDARCRRRPVGGEGIELSVSLQLHRLRLFHDGQRGVHAIVGSELLFSDRARGRAVRTGAGEQEVREDLAAACYDAMANGLALSLFCNPFLSQRPWHESRARLSQVVGPSLSELAPESATRIDS